MNIPKVIHQTAPNWSGLDSRIKAQVKLLRLLNSDYEHRFYSSDDCWKFIKENYGEKEQKAYLMISKGYGAARADFFRYLLMLKVGGVYLDIKSSSSRPFREVIKPNDSLLLSHWSNGWGAWPEYGVQNELQQWHIIAKPNHSYIKYLVDEICSNIYAYNTFKIGVGQTGVLRLTGPIAYTKAIEKCLSYGDHRFFDAEADGLIYKSLPENLNHSVLIAGSDYRTSLFPVVKRSNTLFWTLPIVMWTLNKLFKIKRSIKKRAKI